MRREVNISIWWKFIAYEILHVCLVYSYALMKYNTFHRNNYYTVEYDTITHAFISACIELSSCAIFDITLLIVCINKSKKNICNHFKFLFQLQYYKTHNYNKLLHKK